MAEAERKLIEAMEQARVDAISSLAPGNPQSQRL